MRVFVMAAALTAGLAAAQTPPAARHNPVIALLERGQPVFGVYAPSNRRPGRPGAPAAAAAAPKSAAELAREAVGYTQADFIFDGSLEGGLAPALPGFAAFVAGMRDAGVLTRAPLALTHPLIVKTPELDEPTIHADIAAQLNLGVSGLMFPKAERADAVRRAIAAMRLPAHGGTRPADVGSAPAFWGMSEAEYRARADLWPLNPRGELINWTIIESHEGLARVREIAAVEGVGVLWPGAGTLRGLFSSTNAAGERVLDEAAWEAAIQKVLAACKEFRVACGYPASAADIERRMQQGFRVFVMGWGEPGFAAVAAGRRAAGRPGTR